MFGDESIHVIGDDGGFVGDTGIGLDDDVGDGEGQARGAEGIVSCSYEVIRYGIFGEARRVSDPNPARSELSRLSSA